MWKGLGEADWSGLVCSHAEARLIREALVDILPLASAYAKSMPSPDNKARVALANSLLLSSRQLGSTDVIAATAVAEAELRGFRTAVERAALHCCEQCGHPQTALTAMPK